jgi:hypothetical protein
MAAGRRTPHGDLSLERDACAPQLHTQALFMNGFRQARASVTVHLDCQSDDLFSQ